MRLLVVYCHPDPDSFSAALCNKVVAAAEAAGHQVDLLDLYAEGFEPVMHRAERQAYHDAGENERPVAEHIARLRATDGLIFVYPTWWYGQPAMLKGWLDRVWVPHVAFTMPTETQPIGRGLTNIRLIGVVTTLGSPWWWWQLGMGAPGRRILLTGLGAICHRRARKFWLAMHSIDTAGADKRKRFLQRVDWQIRQIA
ncbi:MAG: NAD(P)H-dependent oxidoreductase [Pseudomonadota bacterium]